MVKKCVIFEGFAKPNNCWLGRQYLFQTCDLDGYFKPEVIEREITEIREVLERPDG